MALPGAWLLRTYCVLLTYSVDFPKTQRVWGSSASKDTVESIPLSPECPVSTQNEFIRLIKEFHPGYLEPSDEEPQQEEPPTESRDPTPGQKREDQGAADIRVPDLEADLQELSQSKTGDECGDGPDVQGTILPKAEQFKMPEGGERQPQV
ncbi:X antigen family member 5-like [Theropithecus gelada]|uniref:X antigen family member 5-like n=1 Tax=Theropithecus gelada TaxID=9565 RepID=UPI000DC1741E|nr:X antigen family member 5-like [Theropithecus gelada]